MKKYSLQGRQSSTKVFCFPFCPFAGRWAPRSTQQPLNFTLGTNPVRRKRSRRGVWLPLSLSVIIDMRVKCHLGMAGHPEVLEVLKVGMQSPEGKVYLMDLGLWWRKEERSCWFGSGACGCLGLGRSTKKEKFGAGHVGRVSPMRAFEHWDQGDLPFLSFSHCPHHRLCTPKPRAQRASAFWGSSRHLLLLPHTAGKRYAILPHPLV